jgi:CAAX amino terminal protease family.
VRTERAKLSLFKILAFYVIFLAVWSVFEIWLVPIMESSLGAWEQALCGTVIKLAVWTVPAVLLVRHYKEDVLFSLREMFTARFKWYKYTLILLGFAAYNIIGALIVNRNLSISSEFEISSLIGTVIFVGITEEVVFRGFLLNALLKRMKAWPAVLLTALMFLVIHFPIWIHEGVWLSNLLSGGFFAVILLSIIFSWTFIKSKNIIVPIVLHMAWNLLIILFFGS